MLLTRRFDTAGMAHEVKENAANSGVEDEPETLLPSSERSRKFLPFDVKYYSTYTTTFPTFPPSSSLGPSTDSSFSTFSPNAFPPSTPPKGNSSPSIFNPSTCNNDTLKCNAERLESLKSKSGHFEADSACCNVWTQYSWSKLTNLTIRCNPTPLQSLAGLKNLSHLDLSNNGLTELMRNTFINMTHLQFLNLSNNRLDELPTGLFDRLTQLKSLDLSGNTITLLVCLTTACLSNTDYITYLEIYLTS